MRVSIDADERIPMRDGVRLAADVYRPETRDRLPVLIQRTPYHKQSLLHTNAVVDIARVARSGYAVVVQDTRGRYASEGVFTPFRNEAQDGVDTVEWAASRPWSSGRVGMLGGSYPGAAQWLAAGEAPAALRAIAPAVTGDDYYEGWTYQGGALQRGFLLHWLTLFLALGEARRRHRTGAGTEEELQAALDYADACDSLYSALPPPAAKYLEEHAPYVDEWLAHPTYDGYWSDLAPKERYGTVACPALNVGGWHDIFLGGTLRNFQGMRQRGGTDLARSGQRLIVGPWAHGVFGAEFPERSLGIRGSADQYDLTGAHLRWFDWLLKDVPDGVAGEPPIELFVTGADRWRHEHEWPPARSVPTRFHLASAGGANSSSGDGALTREPPTSGAAFDSYRHDPGHPVPTLGGPTFLPGLRVGRNSGPRDQRAIERRQDVLCYTSPALAEGMLVIGPITAVLFLSSTAADTDAVVHLTDVWPDGRSELVASGIVRAARRGGDFHPLRPEQVYRLEIDLIGAAHVFARHHRIRLNVSSSSFPRFDVNRGDGSVSLAPGAGGVVATNYVHHTDGHHSHVVLPVVREPG